MSESKKGKKRPIAEAAPTTPAPEAMAPEPESTGTALDAWAGYWLSPIAAARIFLLRKVILFVLAFDVLATHCQKFNQ